jgi:hypothetical protein
MSGDERRWSMERRGAASSAPPAPTSPPLLLRPAPTAAVALTAMAIVALFGFMAFGDRPISTGSRNGTAGSEREKVLALTAGQTAGAFKFLPEGFAQAPESVLTELNLSVPDKARLAEKLADGSLRLAALTLWDAGDDAGETVELRAAGFSQLFTITRQEMTVFFPVLPGGNVLIKPLREHGRGPVALSINTDRGPYRLPPLGVDQAVKLPVR